MLSLQSCLPDFEKFFVKVPNFSDIFQFKIINKQISLVDCG